MRICLVEEGRSVCGGDGVSLLTSRNFPEGALIQERGTQLQRAGKSRDSSGLGTGESEEERTDRADPEKKERRSYN